MEKLPVEKNKYQVFFLKSICPFPFCFAVHTWVVTNEKGELNRWEVLDYTYEHSGKFGYVHKNLLKPTEGFAIIEGLEKIQGVPRTKSKLIATLTGGENSLANRMINFLEKEAPRYEHKEEYVLYPGPNSNSFTQWVINNFEECKVELPKNALGKDWWDKREPEHSD